MLEQKKLAFRTPEQLKHDGLLESTHCAKGICTIQQYVEGSDIENAYDFRRRNGCWFLTKITNSR